MNIREYLRTGRQRKARKKYEQEKAHRDRQRAGDGAEGVAERLKDSGALGGGH